MKHRTKQKKLANETKGAKEGGATPSTGRKKTEAIQNYTAN